MIIKCEFCGGALKFDPDIQKMVCEHCTRMYNMEEVSEESKINYVTKEGLATYTMHMPDDSLTPKDDNVDEELLDCQIYECKSCGAKLVLNNVETATFCAYCGQPTVVFDRISKRRRPKYIIPFVIDKEEALERIKNNLGSGKYISKNLQDIEVDLIRGIYVPYAIFDIYYKDKQLLKGSGSYYFRAGVGDYRNIPMDASLQFPNELSELLEPFNLDNLTLFKSKYLSGYYADLRDEDFDDLKLRALTRTKEMFNKQISNNVPNKKCKIVKNEPRYEFTNENYALLPVWFMVYHQNNNKYTVMVNGQTGKVIGTVPFDKQEIKRDIIRISTIATALSMILYLFLNHSIHNTYFFIAAIAISLITSVSLLLAAKKNRKTYNHKIQVTAGKEINNYVSER